MRLIEPTETWDIRPWGGAAFTVRDFNGDGASEVLFLQSAGAHNNEAFDPRFPELDYYKTGVEDQELFCMTLTDASGRILWQVGEPWSLQRPFSWNGHWNEFCDAADLDGDGQIEILLVHRDELRVYDGATGALRHIGKLPHSGFNYTRAVRTDLSGHDHVFTKSGTSSRTHTYGNPSVLLDRDLEIVWQREVEGAGHFGNFADIDGDGLDELLIGFSLFDHDGTLLWGHAPLSEGDHLDDSVIADLDGDGHYELALAHDGHDATVHGDDGSLRFRVPMHHCQQIQPGRFYDDVPGLQLLFVDKPEGAAIEREAVIVDATGRELSRHRTLGYYSVVAWPTELGSQSLVRLERPIEVDGDTRVLWVAPDGRELARFDARSSFGDHVRKFGLDRVPGEGHYHGRSHTPALGDLNGDGRDELLISDRETVWVFDGDPSPRSAT